MLAVVDSNFEMVNSVNHTEHVATGWPNVRNMLPPTTDIAFACCDRLTGAYKLSKRNERSFLANANVRGTIFRPLLIKMTTSQFNS